jgi:hypothetical protein
VRPGKPEQSPLLARVASSDEEERMPPEGEPLSPEQIALLRRWIAQGAPRPRQESAEPDPRDHWAFQPPVRPALPASGPPHPIDRFLHAEQRKRGLVPVPEAPPELWIRRAYLDLLGYPPSAEEMDAFLADTRPGAFERLVDRLLSNPAYGERWGRHWMDVWRYSDWYGLDRGIVERKPPL